MIDGIPFTFFAEGVPYPQPRAIPNWYTKTMHQSSKVIPWKRDVMRALVQFVGDHEPTAREVKVSGCFYCLRPLSHYTLAGNLTKSASPYPTSKRTGDIDNLIKPVLDQITKHGQVWLDDSQVCALDFDKVYAPRGTTTGVYVVITYYDPRYRSLGGG